MSGHGGLEDGREEPDEVGVRMEDIVGLVEGDGDRGEPDEVGVCMEDIVVIVEREKWKRRGQNLMKYVRLHKSLYCARTFNEKQMKYLCPAIERMNTKAAWRLSDIVNIDAKTKKDRVIKGKGKYKKWTPEACSRAAFGAGFKRKLVTRRRRIYGKRSLGATSAAAVADMADGCHTHVSDIKR